jgi:hypothetical protein
MSFFMQQGIDFLFEYVENIDRRNLEYAHKFNSVKFFCISKSYLVI